MRCTEAANVICLDDTAFEGKLAGITPNDGEESARGVNLNVVRLNHGDCGVSMCPMTCDRSYNFGG